MCSGGGRGPPRRPRHPPPPAATAARTDAWAVVDEGDVSDYAVRVPVPAIAYDFELDTFQKRAVLHLEAGDSVFIAAHTSAGKTVVAEYAIALATRHHTKAIYSSPIKTLSNQKFRDFSARFPDVGIVTGDVSINAEAACVIMTTEILRSMLYRGADLIRDVEWVIFDEVHYANDAERGVVWEEAIIMLPPHVGLVMLSATVPNAVEFAAWVGRIKRRVVHVVGTDRRPVPLRHQVYVRGARESPFFLSSSTTGGFDSRSYRSAVAADKEAMSKREAARGGRGSGGNAPHNWPPVVTHLVKENLVPAVVFSFSKRKCEDAIDSLRAVDLTSGNAEKHQIHGIFEAAVSRLSVEDREVPQIGRIRDTLKRGIGVHHAGLLPLVKEITEILFARNFLRVLFATETFAMGVNMPARSVVFASLSKHDGRGFRALEPGEYTQMAGRAGRRG
eukprot:contig_33747_g8144